MDLTIVPATTADLVEIKALLEASGLPAAGVEDHWKTFLVARDGGVLAGCGGAETYPGVALIRSIAVAEPYRNSGVGRSLVRQIIDRLASRGLREFYLLTTTAEEYFKRRGFKVVARSEANPRLLASREFQDACPASAVCMRLQMLA